MVQMLNARIILANMYVNNTIFAKVCPDQDLDTYIHYVDFGKLNIFLLI